MLIWIIAVIVLEELLTHDIALSMSIGRKSLFAVKRKL